MDHPARLWVPEITIIDENDDDVVYRLLKASLDANPKFIYDHHSYVSDSDSYLHGMSAMGEMMDKEVKACVMMVVDSDDIFIFHGTLDEVMTRGGWYEDEGSWENTPDWTPPDGTC